MKLKFKIQIFKKSKNQKNLSKKYESIKAKKEKTRKNTVSRETLI